MANFQETGGYCKYCEVRVMVRRNGTSHILHLLLAIVTMGFWIPVWFLMSIKVGGWRCIECGCKASTFVPSRAARRPAAS